MKIDEMRTARSDAAGISMFSSFFNLNDVDSDDCR